MNLAGAVLAAFVGLTPGVAYGGGLQVGDRSARSWGMGGVGVGRTDDEMGFVRNPALMSASKGTRASLGAAVIMPTFEFVRPVRGSETFESKANVLFPPALAIAHTVEDRLGFGLSVAAPYVSKAEWQKEWVGRSISTRAEYRALEISPAVSAEIFQGFAAGIAMNIITGKIILERSLGPEHELPPGLEIFESVHGDAGVSLGLQAGLSYCTGNWEFGVSYQSKVQQGIDKGDVSFEGVPDSLLGDFPDGAVAVETTLPHRLAGGVCYRPRKNITLEIGAEYSLWSDLETVEVHYISGAPPDEQIPQQWTDSWRASFGAEYDFGEVCLRAGVQLDRTPIPDRTLRPTVIDADRLGYCLGLGYRVGEGLDLDVALAAFPDVERTVTNSEVEFLPGEYFNGTYRLSTVVFALQVSYYWD